MSTSRVQVLLFDQDAVLARALARRLESESVGIVVVSDVDELTQRLSDTRVSGLIVCAENEQVVNAILAELRAPGCPSEIFKAEKLTPLGELQGWLAQLLSQQDGAATASVPTGLIGYAPSIEAQRAQIRRVAPFAEMSVLITGETGTGKELVARAIHQLSCPAEPFVSVNCAAIPPARFEAELFGDESGPSTDALDRRVGLLEQAGSGTLFLDEVGELPADLQPKLLRTLETRRFLPVGSQREQQLRARVVSATLAPLLESEQSFRSDLHFRLAGYAIHCPPLRERREDIVPLAQHFLVSFCRAHGISTPVFTKDALELLQRHDFPGNVRELRSLVETAAVSTPGNEIGRTDIEVLLRPTTQSARPVWIPSDAQELGSLRVTTSIAAQLVGPGRPFQSLGELEKQVILSACVECRGSVSRAAQQLGMARSTLRDKLRRYQDEESSVANIGPR